MQKTSPDDDFDLGYRGGHDEITLRAMSYVKLCTEIEDAKPGTTKYMLLESEKRRRDSVPASEPAKAEPNHTREEAAQPPNQSHDWTNKPLGKIALPVIVAALVLLVGYLLKTHLGIP